MGSRKFLVIVIAVLSALAFGVLGSSALEINERSVSADRSRPTEFQIPKRQLFVESSYLGSSDGFGPTGRDLAINFGSDSPIYVTYLSISSGYPAGGWASAYNRSFDVPTKVYFVEVSGWTYLYIDDVRTGGEFIFSNTPVRVAFQNSVTPLVSRGSFELVTLSPTIDFVSLSSTLFSVGGLVIVFVTSHWVVALPLIAFVLVICISVIRRLVKGV